jgi:hypothetical protein
MKNDNPDLSRYMNYKKYGGTKNYIEFIRYLNNIDFVTLQKWDHPIYMTSHCVWHGDRGCDPQPKGYFDLYEYSTINPLLPFNIVFGKIGVGKTTFIKGIEKYDTITQHLEVNRLCEIPVKMKKCADRIIEIREIDLEHLIKVEKAFEYIEHYLERTARRSMRIDSYLALIRNELLGL